MIFPIYFVYLFPTQSILTSHILIRIFYLLRIIFNITLCCILFITSLQAVTFHAQQNSENKHIWNKENIKICEAIIKLNRNMKI